MVTVCGSRLAKRALLILAAVGALLAARLSEYSAGGQVKRDALRPGLVTICRDTTKPMPIEVVQLESSIGLALKAGEAPHPRLTADGGTIRWDGYINVVRAGDYQFSALLRGGFQLSIAGKEVFRGKVDAQKPVKQVGPVVALEAGVHAVSAEFVRLPGEARLQLFWKAPHFYAEPLPHAVLRHLPAKVPAGLESDRRIERGRFLVEELSCASCHRAADSDRLTKALTTRMGPDLSSAGRRVSSSWLYHWLIAAPEAGRGRVMPQLFRDDEHGRVDSYAVTQFLASLGGPLRLPAKQPSPKDTKSAERGRRLFNSIGCLVCHNSPDKPQAPPKDPDAALYPAGLAAPSLTDLAHKTTPDQLAGFLQNPLAVNPSGRMPHMLLDGKEALDLANYLIFGKEARPQPTLPPEPDKAQLLAAVKRLKLPAEELARVQRLPPTQQWRELGKRLVTDRGCANCHTIAPGGQRFTSAFAKATFDDIKHDRTNAAGCLADDAGMHGKAPRFALTPADRKAVQAFLREGTRGAGSPSPPHAARIALQRFKCLACHSRDGEGGLTEDVMLELRKYEKAENAEAITPPPLTGIGEKLRTPWLKQVLMEGGRARPWMSLRMPQFGAANVGHLPEALAALDGCEADTSVHAVKLTPQKIQTGRFLVGKGAHGCISCHDIAGIPNHGTRGPDLALMSQRVRFDWYRRWMESAQRMQPGTKMPTVFPDGKSLLDNIYDGNADAQAEAIWAYLSLGSTLQLPEGIELPKGLIVKVGDRPVLVRTFLADAGTKAIAVGYPSGVSTAFDAITCRLAFGWTGNFLDASPVWADRGGAPAKVLGLRFWSAPPGCPWAVTESSTPPDFSAQAKDPAFGGPIPDGKVYHGPQQLFFSGYVTDKKGMPTFQYRLDEGNGAKVTVRERPEPLRSIAGVGLGRHFTLDLPANRTLWFFAGETAKEPRIVDADAKTVPLDLKKGSLETATTKRLLIFPQAGDRMLVLSISGAPDGTLWHLRRHESGTWRAYVRLPMLLTVSRVQLHLDLWSTNRDDPASLKTLLSGK